MFTLSREAPTICASSSCVIGACTRIPGLPGLAVLGGQVEQPPRHPPSDVEEHHVLDGLVLTPDHENQDPEQLPSHLGMGVHVGPEVVVREGVQERWARSRARRPCLCCSMKSDSSPNTCPGPMIATNASRPSGARVVILIRPLSTR